LKYYDNENLVMMLHNAALQSDKGYFRTSIFEYLYHDRT
jgi:hypothetical protein